ncbi:MAG: DUF3891 family protein [Gemmatimonadota bacterium]
MIIRERNGSLLLIRQPDHAALARRIMQQWGPLRDIERRESILTAVGAHDNGWAVPDSAPIVHAHSGELLDFVALPLAMRQGVWPRAVGNLAADPWAAALVAHHAIFVYDRFRGRGDWAEFFRTMERERDAMLQRVQTATSDDLTRDYTFVRLGDLASLTFCCGWTDTQRFAGCAMQLHGTRLLIDPDPFEGRETAIDVSARELPVRRYVSDADAAQEFARAPLIQLRGTVAGAQPHA